MSTVNPTIDTPTITTPTTVGAILTEWIKALRSGAYRQGIRYLCKPTPEGKQYCCLGVLCEVLGKKEIPNSRPDGGMAASTYLWPDGYHTSGLGSDFWVSLMGEGLSQSHVWQWNDSEGFTFKEIATLLERHLGTLAPEHLASTPVGLLSFVPPTPTGESENTSNLGAGPSSPTA